MSKNKQNINIRILEERNKVADGSCQTFDFSMPLSVIPDIEPDVRYAGIELQNTIYYYMKKYDSDTSIPTGGFVAMAALDIAYRHRLLEEKTDYSGLLSRISKLNEKAELLINKTFE